MINELSKKTGLKKQICKQTVYFQFNEQQEDFIRNKFIEFLKKEYKV